MLEKCWVENGLCLHCQSLAKKTWCLSKSLYLVLTKHLKKNMSINHEKYCVCGAAFCLLKTKKVH